MTLADVSGVVVFAALVLAAVASFLIWVLLDRPHKTLDRQVQFLDGLRRISSRLVAEGGATVLQRNTTASRRDRQSSGHTATG